MNLSAGGMEAVLREMDLLNPTTVMMMMMGCNDNDVQADDDNQHLIKVICDTIQLLGHGDIGLFSFHGENSLWRVVAFNAFNFH